eukprot:TRINITY_DN4381_c0_g1_i2.p1 TRINITY_DN4381_c0_g1~~TRINITY_DN4381_c0_g1_i2.p1  ORF type:complete len:209 (+),score=41.26 TRINITY_DN4381_c0_g1_i2:53-679(+)
MEIIVVSRKSNLALVQTESVVNHLSNVHPDMDFRIQKIETKGDLVLNKPLSQIGGKGLFTKELEDGILEGRYHFAVHSLKDLPTSLDEGLILGAVGQREDPRDVFIARQGSNYTSIESLPDGSVIGTSSLRRVAQLKRSYPNLSFKDIRGNLNTRLAKLDNPELGYDGIILAFAGVTRLGEEFLSRVTEVLDDMYYAPGQGYLLLTLI